MALVLNEEQQMLKDAAHDFLGDRAPVSHLREIRDSGNQDGFSRDLWSEIVDMGWTAILVPEEHGGLDYGFTGMGIVLEETGRTLTPSPLLSTAMAGVAALRLAGTATQCAELLPRIASGESLLALACDEGAQHKPAKVSTRAQQQDEGFRLTGAKTAVLDGHVADTFILSARTDSGTSLFLVPANAPGVTVERYPELDIHAAARVTFDQVTLGPEQLLGVLNQGQPLLDQILDVARIGCSAEMLGIAQEVFERTLGYLKERKQFGVPIGSFQALQHRAAILFGEIELSKSLVLKALQSLDENTADCAEIASLAKAKVGSTAYLATTEAIQMHGGIGMTDDFEIGFFMKRWRILDTLYGDRYFHLDRFARCRGY
jgi:alkylation response protein AidB-like acyl-CoA dehydrogenase